MEPTQVTLEIEPSSILTDAEVQHTLNPEPTEGEGEVSLPSEIIEDELSALSKEELLAKLREQAKETPPEPTEGDVVPSTIVDEFTTRFNANDGKFTEQDYVDLEAKGYSKEFVDTYVAGVQAKERAYYEGLLEPYGGMKEYADAIVFAKETWDTKQIETYNKALATADEATTQLLVSSLIKEYKSSKVTPTEKGPITQTTQPRATSVQGYETKSDMTKDMNDPRYGKDASYTSKVEAKLLATDTAAWYSGVSRGM